MDISGAARRLADVPKKSVTLALGAPQQVNELWEEVTYLVRRAGRLLDRADLIVARMKHKLLDLDELTESSMQLTQRVRQVADFTESVSKEVDSTRQLAEDQLRRLRSLLDVYQPILESVAPLGREAASLLRPQHLRGLLSLLDELPHLVDRIEPALDGMGGMVPHLEEVTGRMDNVGQVVEGLPGAKALRRRGQAREEESED